MTARDDRLYENYEVEIEENVPLPVTSDKFQLRQLTKVGQSIFIPLRDISENSLRSQISHCVWKINKQTSRTFRIHKAKKDEVVGYRVWLISVPVELPINLPKKPNPTKSYSTTNAVQITNPNNTDELTIKGAELLGPALTQSVEGV